MGPFYGDQVAAAGFGEAVGALRAANPKPEPGRLVWPPVADVLLDELTVSGEADEIARQLRAWDRLADVVAVVIGPGSAAAVTRLVDAAAPPGAGSAAAVTRLVDAAAPPGTAQGRDAAV